VRAALVLSFVAAFLILPFFLTIKSNGLTHREITEAFQLSILFVSTLPRSFSTIGPVRKKSRRSRTVSLYASPAAAIIFALIIYLPIFAIFGSEESSSYTSYYGIFSLSLFLLVSAPRESEALMRFGDLRSASSNYFWQYFIVSYLVILGTRGIMCSTSLLILSLLRIFLLRRTLLRGDLAF
jgi:hypothetical protein